MNSINALLLVLCCLATMCSAFVATTRNVGVVVSINSASSKRTGARIGIPSRLHQEQREGSTESSSSSSSSDLKEQAEKLLAQARALRAELPDEPKTVPTTSAAASAIKTPVSKWSLAAPPDDTTQYVDYRLDIDIGRESGTWMDPLWGASGRRIECTLDVRFIVNQLASQETANGMVKDNFGSKSSPVYALQVAGAARLRNGFDEMKCSSPGGGGGGAYRIDTDKKKNSVARFYIPVDGTGGIGNDSSSSYGDISIPAGSLYFSLPVFGSVKQLSAKEGPVTVRQMGWHTGWRREESRIVGTFRAKPIVDARRRDGF